jgi:hypothetical protein
MPEGRAALGDPGKRRAHATRSDHQHLHAGQCDVNAGRGMAELRGLRAPRCRMRLPYAAPIRVAPNTIRR